MSQRQAPPLSAAARTLRAHLHHEVALAGKLSGGYVYDLTTGQLLLSDRAGVEHPPASVEKLYTSTAALARMGASGHLQTDADAARPLEAGVLHGDLYLRGGGDPTFGSAAFVKSHYGGVGASVQALARSLVHAGLRRVTGAIVGDESYFDSRRGEPSSGYAPDPYLEGTLSGLAFDRGESGRFRGAHAPAKQAALALREALRADGVSVRGGIRAGRTPGGAATLARVLSPTLAQLLGLMLPPSDNFFAEMLIKDLGARFAHAGTTAAGARIVRKEVASLVGVHPQILDGSGLSRRDLTSPEQVVTLLSYLASHPLGNTVIESLAVAGRSGTLQYRMVGSPAVGRCRAKTGTLTGVSNLAGYCTARNGNLIAFAFFNDGISIEGAHTIQDNMAITIARY